MKTPFLISLIFLSFLSILNSHPTFNEGVTYLDSDWQIVEEQEILGLFEISKFLDNPTQNDIYLFPKDTNDLELALEYQQTAIDHKNEGEYESAHEYYKKAIDIFENHPDADPIGKGKLYLENGLILRHMNQYQEGLNSANIGLKLLEGQETEKIDLAEAYGILSILYRYARKFSSALENGLKSIKMKEEILDAGDLNLAAGYGNLAKVYYDMGNYEKTLLFEIKSLEIKEQNLESNSPELAVDYGNIGDTYRILENYEKALFYQNKSLVLNESLFDPDDQELSTVYGRMGILYRDMKKYDQSLTYELKRLQIRERKYSEPHPTLVRSNFSVGTAYYSLKNYEKALEFLQKALTNQQEAQKKDDILLGLTHHNISKAHYNLKDYPKALEHQLLAVEIKEARLPADHYEMLQSYHYLGLIYARQEQFDESKETFQKFEEIKPDNANSYINWVIFYALKNDKGKALDYLKKAVDKGFKDITWLKADNKLRSIRQKKEFEEILAQLEKIEKDKNFDF